MAENTKIEWCHATFNPWRGCTKVSAGCAHCYAETLSGRNPKTLGVWGPSGTRVVAAESYWRQPIKWNQAAGFAAELFESVGGDPSRPGRVEYKGRTVVYDGRPRVFCASLADVFEDWPGDMLMPNGDVAGREVAGGGMMKLTMQDVRARLFALIDATPHLDWLVLTKRPENVARMMPPHVTQYVPEAGEMSYQEGVRPNLWLGTSVENQAAADDRIPHLLRVPAAVRFLSCEPLLSAVRLDLLRLETGRPAECCCGHGHGFTRCPNTGGISPACHAPGCDCTGFRRVPGSWSGIDWLIAGGESGPGARPCDVGWIQDLVRQCRAAGVPVFVKQDSGLRSGTQGRIPIDVWTVKEFPDAK